MIITRESGVRMKDAYRDVNEGSHVHHHGRDGGPGKASIDTSAMVSAIVLSAQAINCILEATSTSLDIRLT